MERILRGIMRYRNTTREQMVREFQKVRDNPEVSKQMNSGSMMVCISIQKQFDGNC